MVQGHDLGFLGNEVGIESALHALTHNARPAPTSKLLHLIVYSLHAALADLRASVRRASPLVSCCAGPAAALQVPGA